MKNTYYTCENCKKESRDFVADKWIKVNKILSYGGRNKDGTAIVNMYLSESECDYHFCNWRCLAKYKR